MPTDTVFRTVNPLEPFADDDGTDQNTRHILEGQCPSLLCGHELLREPVRIIRVLLGDLLESAVDVRIAPCSSCDWWYGVVTIKGKPEGFACPQAWLDI